MEYADQLRIMQQLKRIQGQVQGVARMVEEGRGMVPTVQQFLAIEASVARSMRDYVGLFLPETETGHVRLTSEQASYIKRLISN